MRHRLQFLSMVLITALSWQARAADERCPAIDCDCEAFTSSPWEGLCEAHQKTIVEQCIKAGGNPQTYCRLQGPAATPVALSLRMQDLEPIAALDDRSIDADLEKLQAAEWSLREDIKAAENSLALGDIARVEQIVRILDDSTLSLFKRQRQLAQGLSGESDGQPETRTLTLKLPTGEKSAESRQQQFTTVRDQYWLDVASRLEALADDLHLRAGQLKSVEQTNTRRVAYRIARRAATVLEYDARLLAESGQYQRAARALQRAAGISEQLVTRTLAAGAPEKFTRFYREQAAARWHSATYYWSVVRNEEESQISFENAGQTLAPNQSDDAPSGVAGAEDKAAQP